MTQGYAVVDAVARSAAAYSSSARFLGGLGVAALDPISGGTTGSQLIAVATFGRFCVVLAVR